MPLGQQPDSPAMPPPSPGGAPGGPPMLPKSPAGGPGGPGGSPMLSPGGGAGNKSAAAARIKGFLGPLLEAAISYEPGSKENQAIINAYRALTPVFGKADNNSPNMVPAALQALAASGHKGPLSAAPPPGLMTNNKPPPDMPMPPMGGESEAAS